MILLARGHVSGGRDYQVYWPPSGLALRGFVIWDNKSRFKGGVLFPSDDSALHKTCVFVSTWCCHLGQNASFVTPFICTMLLIPTGVSVLFKRDQGENPPTVGPLHFKIMFADFK